MLKFRKITRWALTGTLLGILALYVTGLRWRIAIGVAPRYLLTIGQGVLVVSWSAPGIGQSAFQISPLGTNPPFFWWFDSFEMGKTGRGYMIPLWFPFLVVGVPTCWLWLSARPKKIVGCCPRCGYSNVGRALSEPCPECGFVEQENLSQR